MFCIFFESYWFSVIDNFLFVSYGFLYIRSICGIVCDNIISWWWDMFMLVFRFLDCLCYYSYVKVCKFISFGYCGWWLLFECLFFLRLVVLIYVGCFVELRFDYMMFEVGMKWLVWWNRVSEGIWEVERVWEKSRVWVFRLLLYRGLLCGCNSFKI